MKVWIISNGAPGNARQAAALASAMGVVAREFVIQLSLPWSWFAPRLALFSQHAIPKKMRDEAINNPPDIVIGCGRAAALVTRWLRRYCGAFAVQILDPRCSTEYWDLVVAPAHDQLSATNVIQTIGALNLITPERLLLAARQFNDLAELPEPRTALLMGGSTRAQRLDKAYLSSMLRYLDDWFEADGGGIMITASRRTPLSVMDFLAEHFSERPAYLWRDSSDGDNPYLGFLAHAQRFVVTPDSVNLISEACATGKPVYSHVAQPIKGKILNFHRNLIANHRLCWLGQTAEKWCADPLNETSAVAAEVWRRYAQRSH
jgi:mitochondrial fission protein ELM1